MLQKTTMTHNAPELFEMGSKLTALRDTLLPKLISGEIRITDTERILEGVV